MKRIYLLLFLLTSWLATTAAQDNKYLVLELTNGRNITFDLHETIGIKWDNDSLHAYSAHHTIDFRRDQVKGYHFVVQLITDNILSTESDNTINIRSVSNGEYIISGLSGNNTLKIYSSNGQLVSSQTTTSGSTSVNISSQPAGIYIIHIPNVCNMKIAR